MTSAIPPPPGAVELGLAIEHFKRVNPHMKDDEYFMSPEKSKTIASYLAGYQYRDAEVAALTRRVGELEGALEKASSELSGYNVIRAGHMRMDFDRKAQRATVIIRAALAQIRGEGKT